MRTINDISSTDAIKLMDDVLFWGVQVMWYAVYGAMKGNLQRRYTMCRLHLIPDANIPEETLGNISNQLRQARPVPKRIDQYDEETIKNFPKIMDYPSNYVIK